MVFKPHIMFLIFKLFELLLEEHPSGNNHSCGTSVSPRKNRNSLAGCGAGNMNGCTWVPWAAGRGEAA